MEILRTLTANFNEGNKIQDPFQEELNNRRKNSFNLIASGDMHLGHPPPPSNTAKITPIVKPEARAPDETEYNVQLPIGEGKF